MAIKELEIQKYPLLSISSIRKNAFGNFAQKFEKKSPSKYPPIFSFFRTYFEKKYGDQGIGNSKISPSFDFLHSKECIWKFRAKIRKEISIEISSILWICSVLSNAFREKEIWRSRDRKFGSRAPRFDLHTRDCGSAAVL